MDYNIEKLHKQNREIIDELRACANPKNARSLDHMRNVMQSAAAALDYTTGYLAGAAERNKRQCL